MNLPINKLIDQTMLRPNATRKEFEEFCINAAEYSFECVALLPNVIEQAYSLLKGSDVHIMAAIGYPRGMVPIDIKRLEIEEALSDGADEIDMVLNLVAIKSGNYEYVERELSMLRKSAETITAKAILETTLLTDQEIARVCRAASEVGIDFVKTTTGFNGNRATLHAVELMKRNTFNRTKVKAAGGINTLEKFVLMFRAGASRIGTSAGPAIVDEYRRTHDGSNDFVVTKDGAQ